MLLQIIKDKLNNKDPQQIIKLMGYKNPNKGLATLQKLLTCKKLSAWLQSGHYDFEYESVGFVKKLCELLEIDGSLVDKEIELATDYNKYLQKLKECTLSANTNFKRNNEPIMVLVVLQSTKCIKFDINELVDKSLLETLQRVSEMIIEHYEAHSGKLAVWGEIKSYTLHYLGKRYHCDLAGKLITS